MNEAVITFAEIISGARVIPLSQGKFAIVDAEDYERVISVGSWCFDRYPRKKIHGKLEYMHRFILGDACGKYTDHKNLDKLDNRRSNLRVCSQVNNIQNCGIKKNNACGLKGIYYNKLRKKWHAQIMFNWKRVNLGFFTSPEEAHAAYCEAGKKLHGEFFRAS
jgi:hypothetical protein